MRLACTPVTGDIDPDCDWVFDNQGIATRKIDGVNVKIDNGIAYQRIKPEKDDYKEAEYEPVTNLVVLKAIQSRSFWNDGIYEAYGEGIRGNKEKIKGQAMVSLVPFDPVLTIPEAPRTYQSILTYLSLHNIEGIVFHRENGQMAKIKLTDFYHCYRV